MGEIIKSVCGCQSVSVSVRLWALLLRSHFLIIFTKIGTDIRSSKINNEFVTGSISHHPFPYSPQKTHFRPRSWKPMQIL